MNKLNVTKFSAVGFILILLLLHFLNSSVNPNWQPISEYALGNFGWLMNLAFILFGVSFVFLGIAIFQKLPNISAKIGAVLLILSSIGNFIAGFFNTDPITTKPDNISTSGEVHSIAASFLGFMILATIFITIQFYKQNSLKPYKKPMLIMTVMLWVSELTLVGFMGYYLSETNGMISEETPIGWYGRIVVILCAIWCYMCANNIRKSELSI
ncbi:DUF998 domain-containing protein [Sphingobacterium sp. SYP-B4668]|uniref:DUF998 domain-containing protein n=1 Tax=Sphingobacterium sp. SYP-B4668 TaxID=2996035 RepID=UPI0022DDDD95|nr:DUF998 domain-containing protein [Sphingobacterium sp. SYP-B4668]